MRFWNFRVTKRSVDNFFLVKMDAKVPACLKNNSQKCNILKIITVLVLYGSHFFKHVEKYLYHESKIKKKNTFNLLPINLNFTWKYFLIQHFMSFPMVYSLFQSHFPFKSYLQKFPSKNYQIMWYRVLCVEEKSLCDINNFLRVKKWFPYFIYLN